VTVQAQEILHSFDALPDADKREVATEILRRSVDLGAPPLSDEELVFAAEEIFLRLDRNEAADAERGAR
jgi:hypothetical protein